MSRKIVRTSNYRHVFGEVPKKEQQWTDLRPNATGDGNCLTCSKDMIAFPMVGGGGPVAVLNVDTPGRQVKHSKISMHKGKVTDLAFNPFNSRMIATASEDCMIKCTILDAEKVKNNENFTVPDVQLKGHNKKLTQVQWHPTAANILASVSYDNSAKIWDVTKQTCVATIKVDKGIHSAAWNPNGSLLGMCGKDKQIHISDPRTNGEGMKTGKGPEGTKRPTIIFIPAIEKILVLGFTRTSKREYSLYDINNFDKPLSTHDLDQSAGIMMPHYDPDNNIVYIAGKGDSSIKYFEVTETKPFMHHLSEFTDSSSQKGIGFAPKYTCDTSKCEIAKAYRVLRDSIQPVSFRVPRKSEMFQEDIFPDTNGWTAPNDAEGYMAGKDADVAKISMDPEQSTEMKDVVFTAKKSYEELETELAAALKRIAELEG